MNYKIKSRRDLYLIVAGTTALFMVIAGLIQWISSLHPNPSLGYLTVFATYPENIVYNFYTMAGLMLVVFLTLACIEGIRGSTLDYKKALYVFIILLFAGLYGLITNGIIQNAPSGGLTPLSFYFNVMFGAFMIGLIGSLFRGLIAAG